MRPQGVTTTRLPVTSLVSRCKFKAFRATEYCYSVCDPKGSRQRGCRLRVSFPAANLKRSEQWNFVTQYATPRGHDNAVAGYESRFPLQFRRFSQILNQYSIVQAINRDRASTVTRLPVTSLVSRSNFDVSVKFQINILLCKRPVAIERRP